MTWVLAGSALLLGASRTSRALTWVAALGLTAYLGLAWSGSPWPLTTDDRWPASVTAGTLAWWALTLAAAVVSPTRRRTIAPSTLWRGAVTTAAGTTVLWFVHGFATAASGGQPIAEQVRSTPAALVAFVLVVACGMARARGGLVAARFLALAPLPVMAQLPPKVAVPGAALAAGVFLATSLAATREQVTVPADRRARGRGAALSAPAR